MRSMMSIGRVWLSRCSAYIGDEVEEVRLVSANWEDEERTPTCPLSEERELLNTHYTTYCSRGFLYIVNIDIGVSASLGCTVRCNHFIIKSSSVVLHAVFPKSSSRLLEIPFEVEEA